MTPDERDKCEAFLLAHPLRAWLAVLWLALAVLDLALGLRWVLSP